MQVYKKKGESGRNISAGPAAALENMDRWHFGSRPYFRMI